MTNILEKYIKKYLSNLLGLDMVKEKVKKVDGDIERFHRDADYWHRTFRNFSFTECAYCNKKLMLFPYETESYYKVKGNKAVHSGCYEDWLKHDK